MIKIKKGNKVMTVTKAAYKNFFINTEWVMVDESTAEVVEDATEQTDDDSEGWDDEEVTKPISEMTMEELETYANEHGIDISGGSTAKQVKAIIKATING